MNTTDAANERARLAYERTAIRSTKGRVLNHNAALEAALLAAQVAGAAREDGWIAVADRAPHSLLDVLCVIDGNVWTGWYNGERDDWHVYGTDGATLADCVTHWRFLPDAPSLLDAARLRDGGE